MCVGKSRTAHPMPPCLQDKFWALHYSVYQKGDGEEAVLAGKTDKIGDSVKLLIESYVNSGQKAAQRDHQSTPLLEAG